MTARQIKNQFFPDDWAGVFSFAVIRNPWDWLSSSYWYKQMYAQKFSETPSLVQDSFRGWADNCIRTSILSFKEFVTEACKSFYGTRGAIGKYCAGKNGFVIVKHLIKYDDLEEGWKHVCEQIPIPYTPLLRTNQTFVNDKPRHDYRQDYDDELVELVQKSFIRDIIYFNYEF